MSLLFAATLSPLTYSPMQQAAHHAAEQPLVTFMMGGNYPPYDFLENRPGAPETQTGFGFEFAKLVCEEGRLDCRFIRDTYDNCWTTDDFPGSGIQAGYFQACSTYTNTYLRQTGVEFGHSFTQGRAAGVLSRLENGVPVIDPSSNMAGKKIALVGGWATNGQALAYITNNCTGELFADYSTFTPEDEFTGPDAAIRALLDGEADGIFMYASTIRDRSNPNACFLEAGCDITLYTDRLGVDYAWIHTDIYEYQANGTTLAFTHKASGLNQLLNPHIQTVLRSKEYADLCHEYIEVRGFDDISCFPNEFMSLGSNEVATEQMAEKLSCQAGYCQC